MNKAKEEFISLIDPLKTKIISKLPLVWVFGATGNNSNRSKFLKWHLQSNHDLSERLRTPEDYPNWLHFNQYSNLVDFELDITAISQAIIIFSESTGTTAEIGMLSCFTELHKNILIVIDEEYIKRENISFFNLGPIRKIKENMISEDLTNVWALNVCFDENIQNKIFSDISDHVYDMVTTKNNKDIKLDINSRHHKIMLLLDLIDLFPKQTKKFYTSILKVFNIEISTTEFKKIIDLLDLLQIILINESGNNTYYSLKEPDKYTTCINYQATSPNRFERKAFKIDMRGRLNVT
ncbi:hypothetical protein F480_08960 [Bibersteinia trehalosi Y31]|uniref:Uncharacterized protein n=1 Tax=Bibersteinia trehalosi Y31 TaxID=1261658 RepID=A0A179CYG3_BIBTR|nr:retron St85 family effector protein [Bibersteinia trehalosi]OAQ14946.1 hypothetical protein F480_08960 [Bibersteinia trehalosi Y31]